MLANQAYNTSASYRQKHTRHRIVRARRRVASWLAVSSSCCQLMTTAITILGPALATITHTHTHTHVAHDSHRTPVRFSYSRTANAKRIQNKLDPYGTDGRLFRTDVSANFKVT